MIKMMANILFLGLTAVALAGNSPTGSLGDKDGETKETGFVVRNIKISGTMYRYQVYVPEDYASQTNWPVMLFLHGSGERGDDGLAPTKFVIGNVIKSNKSWFPCLVVFPQCRKDADWTSHQMDAMVMGVLDQTVKDYAVDTRRIYLTGLSMGGCGVWSLAAKHPGKFAALVPVCGFIQIQGWPAKVPGGYAGTAKKIGKTPVWVFHGALDKNVPVTESRKMVSELRKINPDVKFTEYPDADHNGTSSKAYADRELYPWLLSQEIEGGLKDCP